MNDDPLAPRPPPLFSGIPIYKDDLVSKTRTERDEDGEPVRDANGQIVEVEVLCWKIFDAIHVHPDNWELFTEMVKAGKDPSSGS